MFLERLTDSDLIILNALFLLILLFFMFRWFFAQVRDICRESEGFIKFGQITFVLLSWGCFVIILGYYLIKPTQVNALDIFLTIVVGFLGTILGMFFSKEALESLVRKIRQRDKTILDKVKLLREAEEFIKEIKDGEETKTRLE